MLSRSSCRLFSPTAQELLACTCVETEWSTKCKTGRCRELGYTIAIASKRLDVAGLSSVSKFALVEDLTSLVFFKNTECSSQFHRHQRKPVLSTYS